MPSPAADVAVNVIGNCPPDWLAIDHVSPGGVPGRKNPSLVKYGLPFSTSAWPYCRWVSLP